MSEQFLIKHNSGIPLIDNRRFGMYYKGKATYIRTDYPSEQAGCHVYDFQSLQPPLLAIQLMANRVVTIKELATLGGNSYRVFVYCAVDSLVLNDPSFPIPEVYIFSPTPEVEALSGAGLKLRYPTGSYAITHSFTAPGPKPLWLRSRVSERGTPSTAAKSIASFTKPAVLGIPMHSGYVSRVLGYDPDTNAQYGDEEIHAYGYLWDGGSNVYTKPYIYAYHPPPVYGVTWETIVTPKDSDSFIIDAGLL